MSGIGGDDTIRMITDGLAGTGIPLLGGHTRKIDLVKLSVDNKSHSPAWRASAWMP